MSEMEEIEGKPLQPEETPVKEDIVEETDLFEYKLVRRGENPFLSRGCCQPPRSFHKPDHVFQHRCSKFDTYDWLKDIPDYPGRKHFDVVEVRFKNSRKDFFNAPPDLEVIVGDIVAVEASPGHDIGIVSMVGEMVRFQLRKKNIGGTPEEFKKVYRKARQSDIEKWVLAVEQENDVMARTRIIAEKLGLSMKINDVEFQGDHTKAIFYYTADDRVDFRELIKILAEEFKVRIEMRQIGARQEASRLGGIGSCGRELCCATWISEFKSVTTNAARVQQLSLNPQKLAGQCGKLKCCLNYEYDTYVDAMIGMPNPDIRLKTKKGEAIHQKTDIFQKLMWFSYMSEPGNLMAIPTTNVAKIQEENKKGILPEKLEDFAIVSEKKSNFDSGAVQDELTRFDNA
jgi:cell fate regulator YaaT (PSP1 superfamily)